MKAATRRALLYIFMALFLLTMLMASYTVARYSSEQSSESDYSGNFEYIVSDTVVITSIEEFFDAIRNGYNNIKIDDSVNNPLIISGGISNVRSDLTIDLNGHEIQRNNREPLLNVKSGVSLTITDTSDGANGSLYNPVGSVLQVQTGGTITVAKGVFESGPRQGGRSADHNEYARTANNGAAWSSSSGGAIDAATASDRKTVSVTVYAKSSDSTRYDEAGTAEMPVITPTVTQGSSSRTVNGNMYFEEGSDYPYIGADTYLYYTVEGDGTVEPISSAADGSAKYYYSYVVVWSETENNYVLADNQELNGNGTPVQSGAFKATVYIYDDVKNTAVAENNTYGAIKMTGGQLAVNGGSYYSYFGVDNTFCVAATGGTMTVDNMADEDTPIDFHAYGSGVCIECDYSGTDDPGSLTIANGTFSSQLGDTVRVNSGDMEIGTCTFNKTVTANAEGASTYGDNGSAIDISGGSLEITQSADFIISGDYINGIYSHGASDTSIRVTNAEFEFTGQQLQYNCGIFAAAGNVTCYGSTTIDISNGASNNTGIYSAGGYIAYGIPQTNLQSTITSIDIAVNNSSNANYGIYSNNGSIYGYGATDITIGSTTAQTSDSEGIHSVSGTISLGNAHTFTNSVSVAEGQTTIGVNGNNASTDNFGIQTLGGTINTYGTATVTVYGISSAGIYATASVDAITDSSLASSINISGRQFTCNVYMNGVANLSSTAISTAGGNITFNVGSATINSDGLGITAFNMLVNDDGTLAGVVQNSGNVEFTQSGLANATNIIDLNTLRGTAVYIQGGSVTVNSGVTFDIQSNTSQELVWQTDDEAPHSHDGVLVRGGSLVSNGTLNVTHTGIENDNVDTSTLGNRGDYILTTGAGQRYSYYYYEVDDLYYTFPIKSYAVSVESYQSGAEQTQVTIEKGRITNSVGGGLYVSGGTVTLGLQTSDDEAQNLSVETSGTEVYNDSYNNTPLYYWVRDGGTQYDNWSFLLPRTGGHAVQVEGGSIIINGGSYEAAQGNGILVSNGTAFINGGNFAGADTFASMNRGDVAGAAASYSLKVCGGNATITGGTFGSDTGYGSGAFLMGSAPSNEPNITITGGTFEATGQAGISAYNYANVYFEPANGDNLNIQVEGASGGMTIERTQSADQAPIITIEGGSFTAGGNGIWYGNGNARLTISDGTFSSTASGAGLYFDVEPGTTNGANNVQLSGGTYRSPQNDINYWTTGGSWLLDPTNYHIENNGSQVNAISGSANYSQILTGNAQARLTATGTNMNVVNVEYFSYLNDREITLNNTFSRAVSETGTIRYGQDWNVGYNDTCYFYYNEIIVN